MLSNYIYLYKSVQKQTVHTNKIIYHCQETDNIQDND